MFPFDGKRQLLFFCEQLSPLFFIRKQNKIKASYFDIVTRKTVWRKKTLREAAEEGKLTRSAHAWAAEE